MTPEAPENIQLIRPDGTATPLDAVYDGIDADGQHCWVIITDITVNRGDRVTVSKLPAHTSISFPTDLES